jgi:DNA-binding CsgD family transcriptional regulator
MPREILNLVTDDQGKVIAGSNEALRLLHVKDGVRCRTAVNALAGGAGRICAATCAAELGSGPQQDNGAVRIAGDSYRLVCTPAGDLRVITMVPLPNGADEDERLTPREREVLALVARGYTNPRIARSLKMSASTVRTHMEHILEKLGVRTRAAAAARAIAAGVIVPGS